MCLQIVFVLYEYLIVYNNCFLILAVFNTLGRLVARVAFRLKVKGRKNLKRCKGAVVTVLILSIGSFLGGGMVGSNFEQSFLMGNDVNNATSELIQTYAFKMGMAQGRFSYATAVELIQANVHANIVSHLTPLYKKAPCV